MLEVIYVVSSTIITAVPKVTPPKCLSDLSPISVTPFYPVYVNAMLLNIIIFCLQFVVMTLMIKLLSGLVAAQRPDLFISYVTLLIETNDYVRDLIVDFSKSFDTVNHFILIEKLQKLDIPLM